MSKKKDRWLPVKELAIEGWELLVEAWDILGLVSETLLKASIILLCLFPGSLFVIAKWTWRPVVISITLAGYLFLVAVLYAGETRAFQQYISQLLH